MFPQRFKRSAMFLTNSTHGFMNRMIRSSHVLNQVLQSVELSEACCTLVPDCGNKLRSIKLLIITEQFYSIDFM